ncbi:oleate hydratase, partial [Rhizobacter sp. Root29]|uniref:oleate hydratase n=2 Tax=Rhizobacter TaxID=212743 RepID=UPI001F4101E5
MTMPLPSSPRAFFVGSGIAAMSAAVLLIRDAGWRGRDIRILEELPVVGGALDGSGDAIGGFLTRGGRMWTEEAYVCLWDVLASVPAAGDRSRSVKDAVWAFNAEVLTDAGARLIDGEHRILDASALGFDLHDRLDLVRLLVTPERLLGTRRIDDWFAPHFFETNFWALWRTTFAFQNWHSAVELRRYMLRFLQEFPRIHTLGGVRRTPLNQYDSVVRPMQEWLAQHGVVFELASRVLDADFAEEGGGRRIERLHGERAGRPFAIDLARDDKVFLTLGSMTADASRGGHDRAATLVREPLEGAWTLWKRL